METRPMLEEIIKRLIDRDSIRTAAITGDPDHLPLPGEGDVDLFLFCRKVPDAATRKSLYGSVLPLCDEGTIDFFESVLWGTGDRLVMGGVEVFLMYFRWDTTLAYVNTLSEGRDIKRLSDGFYPTGRLYSLLTMRPYFDKDRELAALQQRLSRYPEMLRTALLAYHQNELDNTENFDRAVLRKEVLLFHMAFEMQLDSFLQALFALNRRYFSSRKRTLQLMKDFSLLPPSCEERLLAIFPLAADPETIGQAADAWHALVEDLRILISAKG
ncbi:MAG: DUF4037 domain-containing protein [Eubacteriales bacterium]|nr:DUF4037 domain-containing protein [Eubacteriales bacterium]